MSKTFAVKKFTNSINKEEEKKNKTTQTVKPKTSTSFSNAPKRIPSSVTSIPTPVQSFGPSNMQNAQSFGPGNMPSYRQMLGRIMEIYEQNPDEGKAYANQFAQLTTDPNSSYYNAYSQPTNKAVNNLKAYGIDTNTLTDEWFNQNMGWITSNLYYNGTTNTPSKPGKKATQDQKVAYELYQYSKSEGLTKTAEKELQDAIHEAQYLAWRSDRNYSDDEVIGKVREDFAKKYPTLAKMENGDPMSLLELNRAVFFSDDVLRGAAYMGRNSDFNGTIEQAMAYSALGRGNQWVQNDEIASKLDPNSPDFAPYSVGSTNLDDAAFYFGVSAFTKEWIDDHKDLAFSDNETDKKMYAKVSEAYNNQVKAEQELEDLMAFIEKKSQWYSNPDDILKKIDWKKYPTLTAMDKSIGQNGYMPTGNLVAMTQGLGYRYDDLAKYVGSLCDYKKEKVACDMYISGVVSALDKVWGDRQASAEEEQATETKTEKHSEFRPTEQQVEVAKNKDRMLNESADLTEDVDMPSEKAVNRNQLSSMYDFAVGVMNNMKQAIAPSVVALSQFAVNGDVKGYSKALLSGFDTISAFEQNEKKLADFEKTETELKAKLGDLIYAGKVYDDDQTVKVTINGKQYDLKLTWEAQDKYDDETGEMVRVGEYKPAGVFEVGTQDAPQGNYTNEEYQEAIREALDKANTEREKSASLQNVALTEEEQAEIAKYWNTVDNIEVAKERKQEGQEDYDQKKKAIDDAQRSHDKTVEIMKAAGLDTTKMEHAAAVTDFFLNFTKYDPTDWGSYNYYHLVSNALISGSEDREEIFKSAEKGIADIRRAIDVAKTMIDYADKNGIYLPDNVRENVQRYIDSLESQNQDFEYMSLIRNADFKEESENGRKLWDKMSEFDYEDFDKTLSLESQPSWKLLSEEQRQHLTYLMQEANSLENPMGIDIGTVIEEYNGYLDGLKIEHRLFGGVPSTTTLGEIMTDYEMDTFYYLLNKGGLEEANAFIDHLTDGNGVLNSRLRERTEENAKKLAGSGTLGMLASEAISVLLAPISVGQSAAYSFGYGVRKMRGERNEWNPNSADLSANIYRKEARAEIQNKINEYYKDNEVLRTVMSGLHEIVSNRGDSMMNAIVYGGLFDGISNEMLQEFMSAMPMAVQAATEAVSEAKENGMADDLNLLGIFATTLIAEAGTEAISLDNMRDAFALGKEISGVGLKDFFKNWLTKSGLSEMIGETFTEIWEQEWDKALAGENSEYDRLVQEYLSQNNGSKDDISEKEAQILAGRDMMNQVLHTALISYITPGVDVVSYTAGRFSQYRGETKALQKRGYDVSILDVYNAYKEQQEREATGEKIKAETEEIKNNQQAPEGPQQAPEQGAGTAVPERQQNEEALRQKREAEEFTLDIEILESAKDADASSQTASVAAVLNMEGTQGEGDLANAAAANLDQLFDKDVTPAEGVQNLVLGAKVNDVDVRDVKQAIRTAALSENSEARKVMQTEAYQNADPGERAEMLAATVAKDENNATVRTEVGKAVHENRVALAEKTAIDMPEVQQKQKAAYDAQGKLLEAQKDLQDAQEQFDSREQEVDAKRKNLITAGDEFDNDAGNAMKSDLVNHAIADLQKASEVAEEYRQHLQKTQAAEQKAQENVDRAVEDYASAKRQAAEQIVAEQDQQRAEEQAQAEQEAKIQAEQEEVRRVAQEGNDNASVADAEGFIAEQEANGATFTEEDKQKIRERFAQKTQQATAPATDETGRMTDEAQRNRDKVVSMVSKKFGVKIDVVDTEKESGFYSEGYYDKKNNRIVLDKNTTTDNAMYRVLGHELTHITEQSGDYKSLANSILRIIYGADADYDAAVKNLKKNKGRPTTKLEADILRKKSLYDRQLGQNHDYESIAQEVVADRMGQLLNQPDDEKRQDLINRLVKEDASVARRFLESIKSVLKKMVGMKGAWLNNTQKTVDMLEAALKEAQGNRNATIRTSESVPQEFSSQKKATAAEKTLSNDSYREALYNSGVIKSNAVTEDQTDLFPSKSEAEEDAKRNFTLNDNGEVDFVGYANESTRKALENLGFKKSKITDMETGEERDGSYSINRNNINIDTLKKLNDFVNSKKRNNRYSLGGEIDQEYNDAVERKDTKETRALVDEAASNAGYVDKAFHGSDRFGFTKFDVDEGDGTIFVSYHREVAHSYSYNENLRDIASANFNAMSNEKLVNMAKQMFRFSGDSIESVSYDRETGKFVVKLNAEDYEGEDVDTTQELTKSELVDYLNQYKQDIDEIVGQHPTKSMDFAKDLGVEEKKFGSGVYRLYTRPGNQLVVDAKGEKWNNITVDWSDTPVRTRDIGKWAKEHGYDSVRINNVRDTGRYKANVGWSDNATDVGIFFNPNDVKSADLVTRDDDGNVIPLSERFSQDDDLRYSLGDENALVKDDEGNALATELPGGTVALNTGSKYSLSSFTPKEQEEVRKALVKAGYKKEDVDHYLKNALGIAAMIAADRVRLDFDVTDPNKSMVKSNSDYGASIDASTLCAKRLVYQGTFDAIQHMLPNTPLLPEDLIRLSDMMREMGYETPCGICYVESRRRNLGKYISEWLADYKGEYVPTVSEVSTTDGLEKIRKEHPQTYKDFMDAMNSHGKQNNPKPVQLRTEYKGEIRNLSDRSREKFINHGGIRLQSFSDFETPHLLDMVQVVMDIASKRLTSQAYTKVPNFAWVFGDTGIKINLSLIGKGEGVDENGNLIFDDVEGMPFEEAMALRNRYSKNVGTILVGISDRQILAAMADPRIDYIIPFHSSVWTKEDMRLMPTLEKYEDYQNYQTEKDMDTGAKTTKNKGNNIAPVGAKDEYGNGYWDFTKSGKENAETYLDLCFKNKLIPVFSRFLDKGEDGHYHLKEDGSTDGYWKLLIDFKMYDNDGVGSPQLPVTPNVNMNEAYRVLNDYDLTRAQPGSKDERNTPAAVMKDNNSLPVAQPVVERYVEEYKKNHPLDENRVKYSLPEDAPYLSAVDHGNMEEAQQLVDQKAEETFRDSLVRNPDGSLLKVYHGTNADFTEFRRDMIGSTGRFEGSGFNFTPYDGRAKSYGKNVLAGYLDIRNPLSAEKKTISVAKLAEIIRDVDPTGDNIISNYAKDTRDYGSPSFVRRESITAAKQIFEYSNNDVDIYSEISAADPDAEGLIKAFEDLGYDGLIHYGDDGQIKTAVAFSSEQFKSADPVTYDDNGNVIPLSERFKTDNPDIRYSLPSDDVLDQQIDEYLNRGGTLSQPQATPQTAPANPNNGYRQWGNNLAQQSDELDEKAKQHVLNSEYTKDTNAAELDRALSWVRSNKQFADDDGFQESLRQVTGKRFNYRTKDGQARMVAVMALAVARGDVNAQVELANAYNEQGTDLGQALQARKLFRLMTPQGRVATLQKMLTNAQKEMDGRNLGKTLTLSDWIIQAAAEATDEREFTKIRQAAAVEIAEQIPANWKDKLRSLRMLSMLGNPRTHGRNFIGNALFVPVVSLKNKLGAVVETATHQQERTKSLSLVSSKEVREFARQDAEFMKDDLTGESKYNEGNLVQREQKPFKGFLQALMDFNSNALEGEDWFFLRGHYRRALGGWIEANGYTVDQLKSNPELLAKGRAYAINEAQKATYRDFNGVAAKLNQMSRDPKTTGQKVLGFATDAILPFKKTPANILKRGIEYSPVGLVRGLKNVMVDMKSGNITPTQAIDRICSGLAGTMVMAMGYFLSSAGMVKCSLDDDLDKEKGEQKYSIKLFGQDVTFTMDWAAPMSMPFFVGAAIREQLDKEGSLNFNDVFNSISNIAEPVFNLSMLDGVNTLFKTSQSGDTDAITQIGAKVLSNYGSSYVPSALGALARTIDDYRRANYVESGKGKGVEGTFRYAWEQVENKIPGLSQTNIPVRDVFGNPESDSLVERIFENWILPGYISHIDNDPVLNEMARLHDLNVEGSESVMPGDPPKSFKYNNQNHVLTAEEWDKYKTVRGQTAYELLNGIMASADYKNADPATQVQMIKDAWSYAEKVGKQAVAPDYLIDDDGSVESITQGSKIDSYKTKMMRSLESGDFTGYQAMAQALRDEGMEDTDIRRKIYDKYSKEYKNAYRRNDTGRMQEIIDILDMTEYEFDIDKWEEDVDEKYGNF